MAKGETMDPEFDGWMREFEIEPDAKTRAARWKTFQTVTVKPPTTQTECWVRLAFEMQRLKPDDQAREDFAQAFKKNDPTFEPKYGRQLQILACIGLALRLKGEGDYANEAALAILGASVNGARTEVGSLHLVERAKEHVEREIQRRGGDISITASVKGSVGDINLVEAVTKLNETTDPAAFTAGLKDLATSVQDHLTKVRRANLKVAEAADRALARQDQELSMHWWLTGGRSSHLKTPFTALDDKIRPLVLANELSQLTRDRLGPASIDALLARAGVIAARETTIPDVVTACNPNLLDWLRGGNSSPMTTPIHFAIMRQKEMGPGDEWIAPWSKVTEINAKHAISELDLAMQFYREKRILGVADQ